MKLEPQFITRVALAVTFSMLAVEEQIHTSLLRAHQSSNVND